MQRAVLAAVLLAWPGVSAADDVIPIGTRRELFVDDVLVDHLVGDARLRLRQPTPREVVLIHDAPWEGNASAYHSVFKDGDRYRMYYRAWRLTTDSGRIQTSANSLCYAESADGLNWVKPELGLHEFQGSRANNIVISAEMAAAQQATIGGPAVFRDENPDAAPEARYKTFLISRSPLGMQPYQSADGIHFSPMTKGPTITNGAFDSQNLAFWDPVRGEYRAYWRYFTEGVTNDKTWNPQGLRAIRTATSRDLLTWENEADLAYVDSPPEQLYENGVTSYHRAPHLLIGFPVRYIDRAGTPSTTESKARETDETDRALDWPASLRALPDFQKRKSRAAASERYGTAVTEGLFMASRDGVTFKRWNEAFLRPGIERPGTWNYGQQFIAWHPVETPSQLPGAPNELSFYATEGYWTAETGTSLRRYSLRLDGFVSVSAPMKGGELVTKPITFTGQTLSLNFATSAAGSLRVELQGERGNPLPGFTLDECDELFGDTLDRTVTWQNRGDVSPLAGQAVRLRFALRDADLYSFQFQK